VSWFLHLGVPRAHKPAAEHGWVQRFSKDFRGQAVKTVFPAELVDPEDPEGPTLRDNMLPEVGPARYRSPRHRMLCN